MVTEVASQLYCDAFGDYWVMSASATFSGVTSGMIVPGTLLEGELIKVGVISKDLLLDGLTVQYFKAGGGAVVTPVAYTSPSASHILTPFTTAATLDSRQYAPLGVLLRLSSSNVFWIGATTANLENVYMSAWGRIAPARIIGDVREPEEVVVKEIDVWPFNRKR